MAAAGRRLIADRFTPGALATVLDAAYGSGVAALLARAGTWPSPGPPDDPGGLHGCHAHRPGCPQRGRP